MGVLGEAETTGVPPAAVCSCGFAWMLQNLSMELQPWGLLVLRAGHLQRWELGMGSPPALKREGWRSSGKRSPALVLTVCRVVQGHPMVGQGSLHPSLCPAPVSAHGEDATGSVPACCACDTSGEKGSQGREGAAKVDDLLFSSALSPAGIREPLSTLGEQ